MRLSPRRETEVEDSSSWQCRQHRHRIRTEWEAREIYTIECNTSLVGKGLQYLPLLEFWFGRRDKFETNVAQSFTHQFERC
jgi:hypothetical protein